ncbi:MAG: hypothetical protein JXA37_01220 [Chloroflexia bacterium]|nr:hypothetical protein [Chloroflexia bacterium]
MSEQENPTCPECGGELWYDEDCDCWVCDECELEFYEDEEDWEDEWDEEEDEEEEA